MLSKLCNDTAALRSICLASRSFAAKFKDAYLWQLLVEERWGAAAVPSPARNLHSLQACYLNKLPVPRPLRHNTERGLKFRFRKLLRGSYQAVLHKQAFSNSVFNGNFTGHISGDGLPDSVSGHHYDILHNPQQCIQSSVFVVVACCGVWAEFEQRPMGLGFVQIKPVYQGSMMKVSPQWKQVQSESDFPDPGTAVGAEHTGEPLWLSRSSRYAIQEPKLGKIWPNFAFHWGEYGADQEQFIDEALWIRNPCVSEADPLSGAFLYPAVLVNAKDYTWVTLTIEQLHMYSPLVMGKAVPLAQKYAYYSAWDW